MVIRDLSMPRLLQDSVTTFLFQIAFWGLIFFS